MKNSWSAKVAEGIAAVILILIACAAAFAQGGKAEPNRIEFKRGATSTTINGVVRGDEEAEYVLGAKKGQRLIIKLTSVPGKVFGVPTARRGQRHAGP